MQDDQTTRRNAAIMVQNQGCEISCRTVEQQIQDVEGRKGRSSNNGEKTYFEFSRTVKGVFLTVELGITWTT